MTETRPPIQPSVRVASLLRDYPELEDPLIAMAPAFRKLKNPVLPGSVGEVATLRQAAAVAQMPVAALVNQLHAAAGDPLLAPAGIDEGESAFSNRPAWVAASRVVSRVAEGDGEDRMPITLVLAQAAKFGAGEMVELTTAFLPAPGIAVLRQKGFRVWPRRDGPEVVRTFVAKAGPE